MKEIKQFMSSNKGFAPGQKKYDKRDILSINSAGMEAADTLAPKVTKVKHKKSVKEKTKEVLRDNGDILSLPSTIADSSSERGIAKKITKNKRDSVSKNKPIPRRDKMKYKVKPGETRPPQRENKITRPPNEIKIDKKHYEAGMKHVKGKGNKHTPFYVPMTQQNSKLTKDGLPTKISQHNPTGKKIKDHKVSVNKRFPFFVENTYTHGLTK